MITMNALPSADYLRQRLEYDAETGVIRWRVNPAASRSWNGRFAGTAAGSYRADGYLQITVDRKNYRAARLIWKMVTGTDPTAEIDHRDTIRSNNRWVNLRECTTAQNLRNTKGWSGRALPKGVSRHRNRFVSRIRADGCNILLGSFDSPEEAHAAYVAAARLHFGEFARAA